MQDVILSLSNIHLIYFNANKMFAHDLQQYNFQQQLQLIN